MYASQAMARACAGVTELDDVFWLVAHAVTKNAAKRHMVCGLVSVILIVFLSQIGMDGFLAFD